MKPKCSLAGNSTFNLLNKTKQNCTVFNYVKASECLKQQTSPICSETREGGQEEADNEANASRFRRCSNLEPSVSTQDVKLPL